MDPVRPRESNNRRRPSTGVDPATTASPPFDRARRRSTSLSDARFAPLVLDTNGTGGQRGIIANGGGAPGEGPAVRRTNSSFSAVSARESSPSRGSPTPSSQSPLLQRQQSTHRPTSILGGSRSPFRTSSFSGAASTNGGATPPMRPGGDSYSSRTMAAALEGGTGGSTDDVWKEVCVRVLPVFNGESLRGYVEDLNELVRSHMRRTISRHTPRSKVLDASLVTGLLVSDLTSLIAMGCLTISSTLSPAPPSPLLSDDQFLAQLDKVWQTYWTSVVPSLESVFWVLRTDARLRARVEMSVEERERSGLEVGREGMIDVRSLALIGFRDCVVLPQIDAIATLFSHLSNTPSQPYTTPPLPSSSLIRGTRPNLSSNVPSPSGSTLHLGQSQAYRQQMVSLLASVLTADESQAEMDQLLGLMRGSKLENGRGAEL